MPVSKSVPSAGMKEEREWRRRVESKAERRGRRLSTDLPDRPLVLSPCDAYRSRAALVSSFLTNRGDAALSEEGWGQLEAKQLLKAVPGGRKARSCGCILGFCLEGEPLPSL